MTSTKVVIDALYRALREDQDGKLPDAGIGVGALDSRRSSIILRVEALLGEAQVNG